MQKSFKGEGKMLSWEEKSKIIRILLSFHFSGSQKIQTSFFGKGTIKWLDSKYPNKSNQWKTFKIYGNFLRNVKLNFQMSNCKWRQILPTFFHFQQQVMYCSHKFKCKNSNQIKSWLYVNWFWTNINLTWWLIIDEP